MVSPGKVFRVLVAVVAGLVLVSIAGHLLEPVIGEFVKLISVGSDLSVPAWYSSLALMFAALLVAVIAADRRRVGDRYALHWAGLALVFFYLSADEMLKLHERASNKVVQPVLAAFGYEPTGLLNYTWVVLYIPLVLVFVLAYARFFFDLPAKTRGLFLVAGLIFVGGGIVVEMLNGLYDSLYGREDTVAMLMTHLEEAAEMLGVAVFIYALMSYIASYMRVTEVSVFLQGGPTAPDAKDRGQRRKVLG